MTPPPELAAEWNKLLAILMRRVGCSAAASDIAQEAYLFAFERGITAYPYVLQVAKFKVFEHLKRSRRNCGDLVLEHVSSADPWEHLEVESWEKTVWEEVEKLDAKYREVISRIAFEDKSQAEIAVDLALSPATVRKRAQRAREAVCSALGVLGLLLLFGVLFLSWWSIQTSTPRGSLIPTGHGRPHQWKPNRVKSAEPATLPSPSVRTKEAIEPEIEMTCEDAAARDRTDVEDPRQGGAFEFSTQVPNFMPAPSVRPLLPRSETDNDTPLRPDAQDASGSSEVGQSPGYWRFVMPHSDPAAQSQWAPTVGKPATPERPSAGGRGAKGETNANGDIGAPGQTLGPTSGSGGSAPSQGVPNNGWFVSSPGTRVTAQMPAVHIDFDRLLSNCAEVDLPTSLANPFDGDQRLADARFRVPAIEADEVAPLAGACRLAELAHDRCTIGEIDACISYLERAVDDLAACWDGRIADEEVCTSSVALDVLDEIQTIIGELQHEQWRGEIDIATGLPTEETARPESQSAGGDRPAAARVVYRPRDQ